jgi:hypothetical protein
MEQQRRLWQHAAFLALLWLASAGAIAFFARGGVAAGLWGGWATGCVAGAATFALLVWSARRSLREVLGAAAGGFLFRMALLAFGLVAAVRSGASPVWFSAGFFGVYLPSQAIEVSIASSIFRQLSPVTERA